MKTPRMLLIEERSGCTIEALIEEMSKSGCSREEMARRFGVSLVTFHDWLRRLGGRTSRQFSVHFDEVGAHHR